MLAALAMTGRPDETEMHWILSLTRISTTCKHHLQDVQTISIAEYGPGSVLKWNLLFHSCKSSHSKLFLNAINTVQVSTAPGTSLDK